MPEMVRHLVKVKFQGDETEKIVRVLNNPRLISLSVEGDWVIAQMDFNMAVEDYENYRIGWVGDSDDLPPAGQVLMSCEHGGKIFYFARES